MHPVAQLDACALRTQLKYRATRSETYPLTFRVQRFGYPSVRHHGHAAAMGEQRPSASRTSQRRPLPGQSVRKPVVTMVTLLAASYCGLLSYADRPDR